MSRKIFKELVQEDIPAVDETQDLMSEYIYKKQELDKLKAEVEKLSNLVKEDMKAKQLTNIESNGYKVTRTESQRITWKEDLLLAKVKTYNKPELIKQVEQVDVAVLEQCVLDGVIDINDLQECQTVTEVVTLRLSKIKEPTNNELCATR